MNTVSRRRSSGPSSVEDAEAPYPRRHPNHGVFFPYSVCIISTVRFVSTVTEEQTRVQCYGTYDKGSSRGPTTTRAALLDLHLDRSKPGDRWQPGLPLSIPSMYSVERIVGTIEVGRLPGAGVALMPCAKLREH